MNERRFLYSIASCMLLLFGCGVQSKAQSAKAPDALFQTIAAQDKALFDAYNTCDLQVLGSMVTEDLEFYHDRTGLATGKKSFLDSIKANICGKVTRELVGGTLEVYPLAGYGAVEMGTHRFNHPWSQDHGVVGEAKFVMVWHHEGNVWKIARVISYEHAALPK